jgi:dynein heavy chain
MVTAISDFPRLETKLFMSLAKEHITLPVVNSADLVAEKVEKLRTVLVKNEHKPLEYLRSYEQFKGLITGQTDKYIEEFLCEPRELEEYERVRLLI